MRKVYCNKMLYLDETIGDILQALHDKDLYDNTLIAMTTDNGGMPFWANDNDNNGSSMIVSYGCNIPYRAGKTTLLKVGLKALDY